MAVLCPECKKDDQVQKVSAILSSGTFTSTYQVPVSVQTENGPIYGNVNRQAENSTTLAKKLALPEKPQGMTCGMWLVIIFLLVTIPLGTAATINDWTDSKYPTLMIIIGLGLFGVLLYFLIKLIKRGDANTKEKIKIWERQTANWNKVYYCHRDDMVFYPGGPDFVTSDRAAFLAFLSKEQTTDTK